MKEFPLAIGGRNCPFCRYYNALEDKECGRCGRRMPPQALDSWVLAWTQSKNLGLWFLLGVSVVVYALEMASAGPEALSLLTGMPGWVLLRFGALDTRLLVQEPYRLVSANFVHMGLLHIVFNSMAIASFGRACEEAFGSARLVTAFVVTGVAGFIFSTFWYGIPGPLTAGASASAFGLTGVIVVHFALRKDPRWKGIITQIAVFSLIFLQANINHAAHFGGLAAGALFGLWFTKDSRPWRWNTLFNIAAILCGVVVVVSMILPHYSPVWRIVRDQMNR
jgi:rhomboid protease GluP